MRRVLAFALVLFALMAAPALAQQIYTHEKVDYSFDLPSPTWRAILEPDAAHGTSRWILSSRPARRFRTDDALPRETAIAMLRYESS